MPVRGSLAFVLLATTRVGEGYGVFFEASPASRRKASPASRLMANCIAEQAEVGT
jgi:hypothetical protein